MTQGDGPMAQTILETAMKTPLNAGRMAKRPRHPRIAAAILAGSLLVGAPGAQAGGVPVIDVTAISQDLKSWIDQTIEYGKEAVRWDQIKQQIDDVRAIMAAVNFVIDLPMGEPLKKVDPKYLVAETCGQEAMGFNLRTAMSLAGIESGDIKSQQQQICVNIRMMQNRKFNDSVDFLDKTIKQAQEAMWENFLSRRNTKQVGGVQSADSDSARLSNQLNTMAQQWATRMQSYDAYIATMEANQNALARTALKGNPKNKLLGDIVQTAVLKGALSVD
jgi:hypothetical protein